MIQTTNWMGGRTHFLAKAYIIFGFAVLLMTSFLFYMIKKHSMSTEDYVRITKRTKYI